MEAQEAVQCKPSPDYIVQLQCDNARVLFRRKYSYNFGKVNVWALRCSSAGLRAFVSLTPLSFQAPLLRLHSRIASKLPVLGHYLPMLRSRHSTPRQVAKVDWHGRVLYSNGSPVLVSTNLAQSRQAADTMRTSSRSRRKFWRAGLGFRPFKVPLALFLVLLAFMYLLWKLRSGPRQTTGVSLDTELTPEDIWAKSLISSAQQDDQDVPHLIPVPRVDREVLQRLAEAHKEDEMDHRPTSRYPQGVRAEQHRWPPMVTALPETHSGSRKLKSSLQSPAYTTEQIDRQFCNRAPCRLLLPLLIAEHEPHAQAHVTQLLALAHALNRTLVLPNVGRGRVGTCFRWDFGVYFDIASAVRLGGGRVMTMDDFRTWVDMRPQAATGQIIYVDEKTTQDATINDTLRVEVGIDAGMQDRRAKSGQCLKSRFRRLDLSSQQPVSVHLAPVDVWRTLDNNETVVSALADELSAMLASPKAPVESLLDLQQDSLIQLDPDSDSGADVLLIHWDVHGLQAFSAPQAPIGYSSKLWSLAQRMTSTTPYLAVTWNNEKLLSTTFTECAHALVNTLSMLLHNATTAQGIETIWLLADNLTFVPSLEGYGSLADMSSEHRQAMEVLRTAFAPNGELAKWKLTSSQRELASISASGVDVDEQGILEDSGVTDILNTMLAMKSSLFVDAGGDCGDSR
ncbi:hypothetical protein POSPLADRAFT_1061281 [Postia placenta MAD-698-R-SB12]|uniref:Uncharacterized protein n=1 Tax=Postia placenta MAD-698-R-SB12 TaxID=670580 RepID=A0A1X6MMK4_9APHY|nr:hypothetical protein POSPLADRAFT_1061281 [Postia placenta MAD-698-R-SB12]OSX57590.1 hypothetical protein POSPLADRAFT_1061281 [Postia placenta MAD-698-R-SB12]